MPRMPGRASRPSSPAPPDATFCQRLGHRLLAWFTCCRRDLPWRRDRDPYRIWVSEIMLQQTQVVTVIPYFERFLAAFPTLGDLARADLQEVLRLWEGLGYYRRAQNLHRAARQLVEQAGGTIPDDPALLARLPGIGRYTLGAILSQAFERRLPVLEANSQRVLARLFGLRGDPRSEPTRSWLWQLAEHLLPRTQVGAFNQALMELGALVCTPAAPSCSACPLHALCAACKLGLQEEIPTPARKPEPVLIQEAATVLQHRGRVFLAQRPDTGRWAGLWEFPHAPVQSGESHEAAAARLITELTGLRADIGKELLTLRHAVTHHRITVVCFAARRTGGNFHSSFYAAGRWLRPEDLSSLPVSAPQRRLARVLLEPLRQGGLF